MVDPLSYFTTGVTKAVVCVILSVGYTSRGTLAGARNY